MHETTPQELLSSLDDWQRGFVDSVIFSWGVTEPTPEQCSNALRRMTAFVLSRTGGEIPADGRISLATRGAIDSGGPSV